MVPSRVNRGEFTRLAAKHSPVQRQLDLDLDLRLSRIGRVRVDDEVHTLMFPPFEFRGLVGIGVKIVDLAAEHVGPAGLRSGAE